MTEQANDTSGLDALLHQRFAQHAAALSDPGFTAAVITRMRYRRRARRLVLGAGWVVSATLCTVLLADNETLTGGWRALMSTRGSGPMSWGPLLAALLLGVWSLGVTQHDVVDVS